MKAPARGLLAFCCGLAVAGADAADLAGSDDIELRFRTAEILIPVLRSLAAPAVLGGAGSTLHVQAAGSDLVRVRRLVAQADRPARTLSVFFREDPPSEAELAGAAPAPADDGSLTLSTAGAMAPDRFGNAQVLGTQPESSTTGVLEGETLQISMPATQSLRFRVGSPPASTAPAASQAPAAGGSVHFEAVSGFSARIWLIGQTVAVDLQPRLAGRVSAGAYPADERFVVYGSQGRWIALADSGRPVGPGASAGRGAGLWVKVQELAR